MFSQIPVAHSRDASDEPSQQSAESPPAVGLAHVSGRRTPGQEAAPGLSAGETDGRPAAKDPSSRAAGGHPPGAVTLGSLCDAERRDGK